MTSKSVNEDEENTKSSTTHSYVNEENGSSNSNSSQPNIDQSKNLQTEELLHLSKCHSGFDSFWLSCINSFEFLANKRKHWVHIVSEELSKYSFIISLETSESASKLWKDLKDKDYFCGGNISKDLGEDEVWLNLNEDQT